MQIHPSRAYMRLAITSQLAEGDVLAGSTVAAYLVPQWHGLLRSWRAGSDHWSVGDLAAERCSMS